MIILRKITSLSLLFCAIYMLIAVAGMEFAPDDKHYGMNTMFNDKFFEEIHGVLGYVFLSLIGLHIIINFKSIINNAKSRLSGFPSKELLAALLIMTAVCSAVTINAYMESKDDMEEQYFYNIYKEKH